ncbi:DUF397 domain-containing protein [Sphaerisporangium corydalis]|uniref:DUF397 domain-containing protein n=1 Tax=Sphaerisporangium corydalis TaxID=1441875 RepID=A0ABV9E4P3_9ACTN|nr:DUF397 domain-containing protein [Sphaerisporangium corydalis]
MEAPDLTGVDLSQATWKKSSRSADNGGNCVEVASNLPGVIGVRDSKNPTGPALVLSPGEWSTFLCGVKHAEFDA